MAELQRSLQTSPAYSLSLYKKKGKPSELNCPLSGNVAPSPQEQLKASATRRSSSFTSEDFGRYLSDVVRDADQQPQALPHDSLQVYYTEGESSVASSLSSLDSSGLDEETVYDDMKEWGPKFEKLSELYSHKETEDI